MSVSPPLCGGFFMFTLTGVHHSFGPVNAINGIDLTIAPGANTALIGPSGCGKSTLLKLMIGLITPTAGDIRFADDLIRPENVAHIRRRVGYVIQEGGLFPHLTARANITLMPRHLRWPESRITGRLDDLLQRTQLPREALGRYPSELSGGQRQRISLMRALMLDPDVLLLDEPLGALDPMIRYDLQQELHAIFADLKKTVILVTHDIAEAAYLADRLVLLRQGEIVQQGPAAELLAKPANEFVERFITAQRAP
jgi:osmoprotectant transport system ATP-binding protein